MELPPPATPAYLIVKVPIPETFAINVNLFAKRHLDRSVPPEALAYVLRRYVDALCGGTDGLFYILDEGLADWANAWHAAIEENLPLPVYEEGYAEIVIPRPVLALAVEGLLRREVQSLDPVVFGFVLRAWVEDLSFNFVTDGALDPAAIVDRGLDRYEAERAL